MTGGPLSGFRILDMTGFISGPFGSQQLGDLGADVIKLEPPAGDEIRQKGRGRSPGMGPVFMNLNRNKRSVVLDLKNAGDKQRFRALVKGSDVLFHNMRPDAMARLGARYEDLSELRPDLVYCQIVGFGSEGPYAGLPAFEDVVQGVSGFADLQGVAVGEPRYAAFAMLDSLAGTIAAQSILAALLHRERTGEGQFIEVPMLETAIAFFLGSHMWQRTFDAAGALGDPRYLTPDRKPFRTKDGYFCTVFGRDRQFRAFFAAAGHAELADDPRFADGAARSANAQALYQVIGDIFAERTNEEWVRILGDADLPGMPMNRLEDLFTDPHLDAVGLFDTLDHPTEGTIRAIAPPVRFSKTPAAIRRPQPCIGEHTEEIFAELAEPGVNQSSKP